MRFRKTKAPRIGAPLSFKRTMNALCTTVPQLAAVTIEIKDADTAHSSELLQHRTCVGQALYCNDLVRCSFDRCAWTPPVQPRDVSLESNMDILDANRSDPKNGGPSFSLQNRIKRALWGISWFLLASWTPAFMHPWRRFLLRSFGARIEGKSDVRGSARVWYPPHLHMAPNTILAAGVNCYNMAPISIGAGSVVSQGAHLCAGSHDIQSPNFQLIAKSITIGENCWVAAEAFIGPGVVIGTDAVLGARAVAFKDLDPGGVYVGNPAQKIRQRYTS